MENTSFVKLYKLSQNLLSHIASQIVNEEKTTKNEYEKIQHVKKIL